MKKVSLFTILYFIIFQVSAQIDSLQHFYQNAMDANEAEDYVAFTKSLVKANAIRPNHPTILTKLLTGAILINDTDLAINTLTNIVLMNAQTDLTSEAYSSLQKDSRFDNLIALSEKLNEEINNCNTVLKIDLADLHPETIAYHDATGSYYFGGVHSREIVKVTNEGKVVSLIDYKKLPALMSVMGIDIDQKNNILWACTTALPQMENFSDSLSGTSSVVAIDLTIGEVVKTIKISDGNSFGDLILDKGGKVYISDGQSNKIYTINNDAIEVFLEVSKYALNLQGLTFNDDESKLYISDYISGIYQIDLSDSKISKLSLPKDVSSKGIDGLYWSNGGLIALQNGTTPKRVLHLKLDNKELNVVGSRMIAQALDILDEPTQGFIGKLGFYFIANSPWGAYNDQNELDLNKIKDTIVLNYK